MFPRNGASLLVSAWFLCYFVSSLWGIEAESKDEMTQIVVSRRLSTTPGTYFDSSALWITTSLVDPISISSADMDGDGDTDIVASFWTGDSMVSAKTLPRNL